MKEGEGGGDSAEQSVVTTREILRSLLDLYIGKRDERALHTIFQITGSEQYRKRFARYVRQHAGRTSEETLEDVTQGAWMEIFRLIQAGEFKIDTDILHYLERRMASRVIDRRRSQPERCRSGRSIDQRGMGGESGRLLEEGISSSEDLDPLSEVIIEEERGLLAESISLLSERDQKLIQWELEGKPRPEMARLLGIAELRVKVVVGLARERLARAMASRSPTVARRLWREKVERGRAKVRRVPSWAQVREAVRALPDLVADAVRSVHWEGVSPQDLFRRFGRKIVEGRLQIGYQAISARFGVRFPEAFDWMPKPENRRR